jgi:hypothetical protein
MNGEPSQIDVGAEGVALADAVDAAFDGWIRSCVARFDGALAVGPDVAAASVEAKQMVMPILRAFFALDIDQQRTTPLTLLRTAVAYPTAVLQRGGVPPVRRDVSDEERFPEDVYNLNPATWSDIGESVAEPGLRWGAAKAFEHRRRHLHGQGDQQQ